MEADMKVVSLHVVCLQFVVRRPDPGDGIFPPLFAPFEIEFPSSIIRQHEVNFDWPSDTKVDEVLRIIDEWVNQGWRGLLFKCFIRHIKILGAPMDTTAPFALLSVQDYRDSDLLVRVSERIGPRLIKAGYENRLGTSDVKIDNNAHQWSRKK